MPFYETVKFFDIYYNWNNGREVFLDLNFWKSIGWTWPGFNLHEDLRKVKNEFFVKSFFFAENQKMFHIFSE